MSSAHGVNFSSILVGEDYENLFAAGVTAGLLAIFAYVASKKLESHKNPLIPDTKLSIKNIAELLVLFVVKLGDNVMGKENRKYLPFVGSIFVFILAMNLSGLIPGWSAPTDGAPINFGIAIIVFILYNYWGIKEVGPVNYFKHFWGPIMLLGPFLLFVELISHIVRPLSLTLRLFGNMTADHMVLSVFTDLTKYVIPVVFYGLGTFVSFMQAFVFTLLAMVYIRLAVTHADHGSSDHHGGHH